MVFSKEWDQRYKENTHMSIWPWSDLVSYVMRYARPGHEGYRVLELGCGAGANIPFFRYLGVEYYAIEGSPTIVEQLVHRFPDMKGRIKVGDFTSSISFNERFDLVVDRGSLTCNSTTAIKRCLDMVYDNLNPQGKYIGIDWFSTLHTEFLKGFQDEDENTRNGYTDGPFANTGRVHYSDKQHLLDVFHHFKIEILEHKIITQEIPEDNRVFAYWDLVARKE